MQQTQREPNFLHAQINTTVEFQRQAQSNLATVYLNVASPLLRTQEGVLRSRRMPNWFIFPLQLFFFVGGVSSFQLWCWASLSPVAMKRKSFSFFLNQLSSFGYYDDCDISDSKENREIAAVLDHVVARPLQNAFRRKQQIQASIRAQYSHLLYILNDVKTCHSDLL